MEPAATPPDRLYEVLRQASHGCKTFLALKAALDSGLIQRLGDGRGPRTVDRIVQEMGLDGSVLLSLCRVLVEMGVLECARVSKDVGMMRPDDALCLSPMAEEYLLSDGHLNQLPVIANVSETMHLWELLGKALEQGPLYPEREGLFGGTFLPALAAEAFSGEAQRTAALVASVAGFDAARDLLDLGGGHGLYSLALCARCKELHAEVMDFENVRPIAERYIGELGDGRVSFTAGNVFSAPLGTERDAVLLFYSPGGKRADLLDRIHDCLKPGGYFVSKHAFYGRGEGSKNPLLDLEWRMTAFPGVNKRENIYSFQGDLCREDYLDMLEQRFEIVADHGPEVFAAPDVGKFGDRLDSRLIVARKR